MADKQPERTSDIPEQSGLRLGLTSFLNNHVALATHPHIAKTLRKEAYQNLTRGVHITHWNGQLSSPVVSPLMLSSEITRMFNYTEEQGWDNSTYAFIPPKDGNDPSGVEYAREEPVAKFFNEFTAFGAITIAGVHDSGRVWLAQHNTPIDNRRKPDLVLVDTGFQTAPNTRWEHVRSICQVKYKDTPDMVEEAYLQLYDNAFFIFTKQDSRLFFIGFTMCGASLRAYLIHRGGTFESAPMSLHTEPWTVAQALVAIAYNKFINLGYDPTIITPAYYNIPAANPSLTSNPWNRVIKIQMAGLGGQVTNIGLIIDTCLFSSHSAQGRGTHVFACLHPNYKKSSDYGDETHLIVKDCWVDHRDRSAYFIHDLLKQRNKEKNGEAIEPSGIPIYLAGHINRVSLEDHWGNPDLNQRDHWDMNTAYFKKHILDDMEKQKTIRRMIHKRFVFETCGVALQWFATIKELVHAVFGAVQGHRNAFDLGILHRDVSAPNVMIAVKSIDEACAVPDPGMNRSGFLADWGLAIDLSKKSKSHINEFQPHFRVGTYPFLSTELMFSADGRPVRHRACDDLESFFWILWIMSVNYTGPFGVTRDWDRVERLMSKLVAQETAGMTYLDKWSTPATTVPSTENLDSGALGSMPTWMPRISRVPTPSTPMSTLSSTSVLTPVDIVAERLLKGIKAQHEFMTHILETRLEEDKRTCSYRVAEFASLNVPAWAKPGGHEMEYRQVAMEKATLSWDMMQALMTKYFAIPPFLAGMEKLHSLFKGETWTSGGKVFWKPPEHAPTHKDVLNILEEMLEGLTNGNDPYPDVELITAGRRRYQAFLESGRFPLFTQPLATENKREKSAMVPATTGSDIAIFNKSEGSMLTGTRSSKRGVETLGEVEEGSSSKMSRFE